MEKVASIRESVKTNKGKRTVIESEFAPGASIPPHYHRKFDKTFEVLEGEIRLWNGSQELVLKAGESATVKKDIVHNYEIGNSKAVLKTTLVPGSLCFENAIKVMQGIHKDGEDGELNTIENNTMVYMAIISRLTDANFMGEAGATLETFLLSEEGKQVMYIQNELVEKYGEL
ncbi:cupin domain-containing protein [Emticicia sp. BO119]|uniref:cupin domain-containing protein n=1 Tax=Emticicia sp. BO119 TaxID=2757768 RepID=UPI0015F03340|nr:cupin domain-containing protein [Emticicia sp. BO119]MBA4850353.1 cupin domain-containing protein [Emticicia sp. BO119]